MHKSLILLFFVSMISPTAAQMTLKLIKPGYYTDTTNTYYVITGYQTSHPDMFPSKRPEIEIVNKEHIPIISEFDPRGVLMDWHDFNVFLLKNDKNIQSPASTIAVKIPNLVIALPSKLQIIDVRYARYEDRFFHCHFEIKEADFKTFEIIDETYAKDKNYAFYRGKKIVLSNALHFKSIDHLYSKDKTNVYFKGEILSNANPKTFQKLGYYYQKDDTHVWDNHGALINADAATLKALYVIFSWRGHSRQQDSYYAIDKNNVYYGGNNIITSAHLATFKVMTASLSTYGIDKNNVYMAGKIIVGADSKTFKVVEKGNENLAYDAFDKNHQYRSGVKLAPAKKKKY